MRWWLFQSTLPARGATVRARYVWRSCADFNPRSPHGERLTSRCKMAGRCEFQSTLPARGATQRVNAIKPGNLHRTDEPRTGSDGRFRRELQAMSISIHAPRTGSDPQIAAKFHRKLYFNPRSPHGERLPPSFAWNPNNLFQSTLPARGATLLHNASQRGNLHFNPRSPHGERPSRRTSTRKQFLFQSTLPARGATKEATAVYINEEISIHAPRTGSDAKLSLLATFLPDFNPRSPHGERHRINMIA